MKKRFLFDKDGNIVKGFKEFLSTNYKPGEYVGYFTDATDVGTYHRTVGELLEALERYPNDLGAAIGDWNPETGAQICINPLDGKGLKTDNITRYAYALVRSNATSVDEQFTIFKENKIPIAVLINTGDKYLDAIIRVDARDPEEYKARVSFLYDYLDKRGCLVNRNLRNPTCLATLPGAEKKGFTPYVIETNTGFASWDEWFKHVESTDDNLPDMEALTKYVKDPPMLPDVMVEQILRKGHKMIISGPSKAGKSFLLMEFAVCIAEGKTWLDFKCRKGKVLYVNLEIDPASAINRFLEIYKALGIPKDHTDDLVVWNLRGHAMPLDKLVPKLLSRIKEQRFDAIIIDPIYKIITGDENSASEMGKFCNQLDAIAAESGCCVIYCHHHSKGAQSYKKSADRASGSGVFGRDPDAILDISELHVTDEAMATIDNPKATAWRMETTLREFEAADPVHFWFSYPIHLVDHDGVLGDLPNRGTAAAARLAKEKSAEQTDKEFRDAFEACSKDGYATIEDMCHFLKCSSKTIYKYRSDMSNEFGLSRKKIYRIETEEPTAESD